MVAGHYPLLLSCQRGASFPHRLSRAWQRSVRGCMQLSIPDNSGLEHALCQSVAEHICCPCILPSCGPVEPERRDFEPYGRIWSYGGRNILIVIEDYWISS